MKTQNTEHTSVYEELLTIIDTIELGSAFLSADLGLAFEPRTDHTGI